MKQSPARAVARPGLPGVGSSFAGARLFSRMSPQALKNSERIAILEDVEAQHTERIRALEDCVSTLLRLERATREVVALRKPTRKAAR